MNWSAGSIQRLLTAQDASGGWGYRQGGTPCAEPTALACLALSCHDAARSPWERGLVWLADLQTPDGGVPVDETNDGPYWPTALSVIAWRSALDIERAGYDAHIQRAMNWLTQSRGLSLPLNEAAFGHDTSLIGWSWVDGTHSWIEPTAYAIRAMCDGGQRKHARVRDGVRLMLDRTLPEGGWNYGNTRVLANTLRPFPATTGIALYGLAGDPPEERIERSIAYLKNALPAVYAPWSLSWGLIGLSAWNVAPSEAESMLANCAARLDAKSGGALPLSVLDDALMLWAAGMIAKRHTLYKPASSASRGQ